MRKLNYFFSFILVITMSLAIVLLSSNLVLRTPATYSFHFNDSEVMDEIPYNITGNEMSGKIVSYTFSFSKEPFQVYEENGKFKDPVFKSNEQQVMQKARNIINVGLAAGLVCLAAFIGIYIYLFKGNFKKALRNRFKIGMGITAALLVAQLVAFNLKPFRKWLYNSLIGIKLTKDSTLAVILGDPFFKTYLIFTTIAGFALLAIAAYVHFKVTKPERIFY